MKKEIFLIVLIFFAMNEVFAQEEENVESSLPILKDSNYIIEKFVSDLYFPTTFDFIHEDMIILEKNGDVRFVKNGNLLNEPILRIEVPTSLEDGLLGILVKNEQVYLHYTTSESDTNTNWFYKYDWENENLVNPELIKKIPGGSFEHNSGVMTLFEKQVVMVIGDLGNREGVTQNFMEGEFDHTSVIMPIDPEQPPIAIGIRNSFGLDVDPKTGFLWDTENGPESFDEINLIHPKFNSGWKLVQGPASNEQKEELKKNMDYNYSDPKFSWERPVGVTSIHFIDSSYFSQYLNSVLIGSFHNGNLYKFNLNFERDGFTFENSELVDLVLNISDDDSEIIFGTGFRGITDIKQGPDGLIYILSIGDGTVYRIIPNTFENFDFSNCKQYLGINESLKNCDFSGMDLSGMDLSGMDLSFSNFENSNLTNTNFANTIVANSNFRNSIMENTNFKNSNLESSFLDNMSIISTNFSESNLINTNFANSSIYNSNFNKTDMQASLVINSSIHNSDFSNSNLYDSDFSNSYIENTNFSSTILDYVILNNIEAKNIIFENARLWKTNLDKSNFENSNFKNSDNYRSTYLETKLKNANFENSRLSHTNFSDAKFSEVNLSNIYPISSNFKNADFDNSSKINTCLEDDLFSKILNRVFRITGINTSESMQPLTDSLLEICN